MLKKLIEDLVVRDPQLFKDIVLAVEKSEADHLLTTNFSNVLGMNRDKMSTVLLHPADHKTKDFMKDKYRRPVGVEDIVTWILNINGETKKHFHEMALQGKLVGRIDMAKLDKAFDQCAANDIAHFKTTQFYHSKGTGQTSDMLRTLDAAIRNVKGINNSLFETGESGDNKLNKHKLGKNMIKFFTEQKEVAAFCYESKSQQLNGCFTNRISHKFQEFKQECYVYFTEGSRRLDNQLQNDPDIIGSYLKFEDILHGKGEYKTVISSQDYATLLFNGRDPFASTMSSGGRSNTVQPSDRKFDVKKVN